MIEHISLLDGLSLLHQCARCLRPGGRIRLTTPDLAFVLSMTEGGAEQREAMEAHTAVFYSSSPTPFGTLLVSEYVADAFILHGHRFLYDFETLARALETAGFTRIVRSSYKNSQYPEFVDIDSHLDRYPALECTTLFVEAERP